MQKIKNTCLLSAEMICPPNRFASSTPSLDFPEHVGPMIHITGCGELTFKICLPYLLTWFCESHIIEFADIYYAK